MPLFSFSRLPSFFYFLHNGGACWRYILLLFSSSLLLGFVSSSSSPEASAPPCSPPPTPPSFQFHLPTAKISLPTAMQGENGESEMSIAIHATAIVTIVRRCYADGVERAYTGRTQVEHEHIHEGTFQPGFFHTTSSHMPQLSFQRERSHICYERLFQRELFPSEKAERAVREEKRHTTVTAPEREVSSARRAFSS